MGWVDVFGAFANFSFILAQPVTFSIVKNNKGKNGSEYIKVMATWIWS